MADKFVYELEIETGKGSDALEQFRDRARSILSGIKIDLFDSASLNTSVNAARSASAQIIDAEQRITASTQSGTQQRSNLYRSQSSAAIQNAQTAATAQIDAERRVTEQLRREYEERRRAQAETSLGQRLGGAAIGGIAGYLTVQGARQIFNYAQEIGNMSTQINRANKAFETMIGSASGAERILKAVKDASGGTVDNFTAVQIANQATALGLAKTTGEFERLTKAARAVTFVSPVIHDVQSAITELALASANLSYRRLDQLGLSVTEVRTRVKDLIAANSGLDESQAFLQASVDALNSKFGELLNSAEAGAGGVERLSAAWANFTQKVATSDLGTKINAQLNEAAFLIDKFSAFLSGDQSGLGTSANLGNLIAGKKAQLTGLSDGGAAFQAQIADLERLKAIVDEANRLTEEGAPGVDQYVARLQTLADQAVYTGSVTRDMGYEMSVLQALITNAASALDEGSKAGNYYAEAVAKVGADAIATDEKMSAIVERMVTLTAEYNTGQVSASEYGAAINTLGGQLVGMASQAAIAAAELANVNYQTQVMLAAANSKLYFGSGGTQGTRPVGPVTFQQAGALATDTSVNPFTKEAQYASQQDYKEQLAKEQEKADRDAAAAAKKSAKEGERLYNQAQTELRNSIAAIVKVSQVTQQDIEDAQNGIYQEKPDEYLRRLRDEVKNGKDYEGVSIEDAADGLNKIGIETAGKSAEAILSLFEQAFSNMSLFADKENLKFLNDGAVEKQLKLKELAKQGQDNVFEHYGAVVGQAVQAALGGATAGGAAATGAGGAAATPATINVDGQGIAGQGIEISATVTKITVADDAAKDIAPKLTFNSDSIVFTGDDAQAARDRLAKQLTPTLDLGAPGQGFYLGADAAEKIKQGLAEAITPTLKITASSLNLGADEAALISANISTMIAPKLMISASSLSLNGEEASLISASIGQSIAPTIKPKLGEPDLKEITALQQRVTELLGSEQAAKPTVASGGLGGVLGANGQKAKASPLATQYVSNLVASFSDSEVTLPLLGVGSFVLGVIDQGFELAKSQSTIGSDIVTGINAQVFAEQNVATMKTIGNNVYQIIIGGIRAAMKAKNNNVGQEIVDTIAGQVIDATVGAVEGATQ